MSNPVTALYEWLNTRLSSEPNWNGRVYAHFAPSNVARPYVVWHTVSVLNTKSRVINRDLAAVLQVMCYADTMAEALNLSAQIVEVLHNQGTQDVWGTEQRSREWLIKTVTEGNITVTSEIRDNINVYCAGFDFEITMEA